MQIRKETNFSIIFEFLERNFSPPTHWPDWNVVVSKFYNTNFFYYTAYEQDNLIGICPIHETRNGFLKTLHSGQLHFIPNGGWIFKKNTIVDESFFPLKSTQMSQGFSLPVIENFNVSYNLKYQKKYWTLLIDLKNDTDYIWENDINSKRRNMIRKAEKSGVKVKLYDKSNLFEFYNFYKESSEKNNLNFLSMDFFTKLFANSYNINFDILWAHIKNKFLGAVVVVYNKNYSFYWLGISEKNTPNLGQGDLLQWEAIKRMKGYGCRYYDLCYIDKEKLPHIYKFKKGFSKTEVPIIYYLKKSIYYRVMNKIINIKYKKGE